MHAIRRVPSSQFFELTIEAFDFSEEAHIERIPVKYADRIVRVHGGNEAVAGVANRAQMPGSDESRDPRDGEVVAHAFSFVAAPGDPD